jgi:hypothetical protein
MPKEERKKKKAPVLLLLPSRLTLTKGKSRMFPTFGPLFAPQSCAEV